MHIFAHSIVPYGSANCDRCATDKFVSSTGTSAWALFSRTYILFVVLNLFNVIYCNTKEREREREREIFAKRFIVATPYYMITRGVNKNRVLLHFFLLFNVNYLCGYTGNSRLFRFEWFIQGTVIKSEHWLL